MNRSSRKKSNNRKKLLWIIPILLVVLIAGYAFGGNYYASHFEPKTTLNGVDISGMTAEEAQKKLTDYYNEQSFTLNDNGTEWRTIPLTELGVSTDSSTQITEELDKQNQWAWGAAFFGTNELTVDALSLDQDALNAALTTLQADIEALNADRTPTQDATIIKTEAGFSIQEEVNGNNIDANAVIAAISEAISNGEYTIDLENYLQQPGVVSTDAALQEQLTSMNNIAQVQANYTINGQSFTIPTETIMDWLTFTDGTPGLDNEKVTAYVNELGNQYNTSTNPTSFNSTRRGTVSVPAGSYSWTIQTEDEVAELTSAILAGVDFTRTPVVAGSTTADAPLVGNTYVEVDLSSQHMWYYRDGALVLETDIVSGKPSTPTPTGVFYIWNKERNATLKGEDYATPVDYWMPIDWEGVGIHDSSWQSAYGGSRYTSYGSHGCINTPPSVVAQLYNAVSVGTPVVVI